MLMWKYFFPLSHIIILFKVFMCFFNISIFVITRAPLFSYLSFSDSIISTSAKGLLDNPQILHCKCNPQQQVPIFRTLEDFVFISFLFF